MLEAGEQRGAQPRHQERRPGLGRGAGKALTDLSTEKVKVNVIHTGVGGITENDVMLATASKAIIIGFNVRPAGKAGATAKAEGVEIRIYKVIYEAIDDVKKAMAGLLAPEFREKDLGKAEVRQVFSIPKIGTVAGCFVTDGKMSRNGEGSPGPRLHPVWEGGSTSLRRFKDDVRDVRQRLRVRHRTRGLQRPQGRRRHRVLRARAGRRHAVIASPTEPARSGSAAPGP